MTEQERINQQLQRQIDAQNSRIDNVLTKVDMLVAEMRERDNQRAEEIRDRDNQRAEDIREMRQNMKDMQKNMQDMQTSNRNLNIVTLLGIAAIVVAVLLK